MTELEKAQERLLECCHDAAYCDAEDFDFYELRRLAEQWELAKINAMVAKIA